MNTTNNFSKKYKALAIIIVVIVGYVGIYKYSNTRNSPSKIQVGVISILSGQFSAIGENFVKGIRLAEEQFEQTHPGTDIQLVIEDDAFDTKKGLAAFQKLTSIDTIDGLINLSTPTINATHKQIAEKHLPTIQFGIQVEGVAKDPIFQISPMAEEPIEKLGAYLKDKTSFKKVAVVYENGAVFDQFYGAFIKGYGKENTTGLKITNVNMVQDLATKIVLEKYDCVTILGLPESGALLVKKIGQLTKQLPTFVIDAQLQTGKADYERILGDLQILNGGYSVWLASSDSAEFKDSFVKKYGTEPGLFADYGYDAFNTLAQNYNTNKDIWIESIQKTKTTGVSGDISFDDLGIRKQNFEIKRIEGGNIITEEVLKAY